jgi:hypothetical protein
MVPGVSAARRELIPASPKRTLTQCLTRGRVTPQKVRSADAPIKCIQTDDDTSGTPKSRGNDDITPFPENTPMVIVDSYDPAGDLAISQTSLIRVKRGEIVNAVSRSGRWLSVRTYDGESGYIPESCANPIKVILRKCKQDFSQQFPDTDVPMTTETSCLQTDDAMLDSDRGFESFGSASSDLADDLSSLDIQELHIAVHRKEVSSALKQSSDQKQSNRHRQLTVLFDYTARHADDVTVRHQDIVILLDDSDEFWSLVQTSANNIGYIPKSHVIDLTIFNLDPNAQTTYL